MVTQPLVEIKSAGKFIIWLDVELDIIRQNFDGTRKQTDKIIDTIKNKFGIVRTYYAVRHKAAAIGMTRGKAHVRWTPEQENELRSLVEDIPPQKIAKKLGRSLSSIRQKCSDLGIHVREQRCGWYTLDEVSKIFGVADVTIVRWVKDKQLKAEVPEYRGIWHFERKI